MAFAKLLVNRIRNAEAVATFSAATCQNLAAIGSLHSVTKTMLVSFLSVRRLECSFHYRRVYLFLFGWRFRTAKLLTFFQFTNLLHLFERTFCKIFRLVGKIVHPAGRCAAWNTNSMDTISYIIPINYFAEATTCTLEVCAFRNPLTRSV